VPVCLGQPAHHLDARLVAVGRMDHDGGDQFA
jgi:hypothetical protein